MSGHSKWANIKHKKEAADAKKGKVFTKLIKEITVAARMGGGDIDANPRLRQAVDLAKAASMPKDNIERAIKKGTGELDGGSIDEIFYEGYGPGGIAVLVQVATDNKNRTVGEIRYLFTKNGGNMGENGSVAWMFEKKGYLTVAKDTHAEETMLELALDAGADDVNTEDPDVYEIFTDPTTYFAVKGALESKGVSFEQTEISMIPKNVVTPTPEDGKKALRLIDALEENDDVTNVYSNFIPTDDLLE